MTSTFKSDSRQAIAADKPAGPAPIMTTSYMWSPSLLSLFVFSYSAYVRGHSSGGALNGEACNFPLSTTIFVLNRCHTCANTSASINSDATFETMSDITVNCARRASFFMNTQLPNAICEERGCDCIPFKSFIGLPSKVKVTGVWFSKFPKTG